MCCRCRAVLVARGDRRRRSVDCGELLDGCAVARVCAGSPSTRASAVRQAIGQTGAPVVPLALDVELVVLAEEFECIDLAGKLEPDPADRAGVLAASPSHSEIRMVRSRQADPLAFIMFDWVLGADLFLP